ncbi:MAG: hypothetical protein HY881_14585 [Deltaproteobacteria bacterium]|nr:hypothetical protein [Deltaproteobacteria bacterium]
MNHGDDQKKKQKQEEFYIDTFQPEDAEGIVRLFRAVYGEQYPIQLFYDPQAIISVNEAGKYYSIIVRTVSGNIIGVCHLYRSAPFSSIYESGVGLVLKEYRNTGAYTSMNEYLFDKFVPQKDNIEEVFGEAVCNHVFTQKTGVHFRHVYTAMEVALMPAAAYAKEKSATGRVAALCGFRCYKPKPHRIHIPAPYEQDLRWIYSRLDDSRDIVLSECHAPAGTVSRIGMEIFNFAQVARLAVYEIGEDFSDAFSNIEMQAVAGKAVVLQAWLNLGVPWVGSAVHTLRERGYFFGGALLRWFDGDGFLMQKLLCPPDFDDIVLDSAESKQLLNIIQRDWERAEVSRIR